MAETDLDVESLIQSGDFARLHEELTNLRPQEVAAVLAALRADDQVIAFRILPRRTAASVFEYLSGEQQRALVKAMGQEDVAELLNQVSPDDRTLFLSELPANVTKRLLALLTPEERAEAVTLLVCQSRPTDDFITSRSAKTDGPAGARLRPHHGQEER